MFLYCWRCGMQKGYAIINQKICFNPTDKLCFTLLLDYNKLSGYVNMKGASMKRRIPELIILMVTLTLSAFAIGYFIGRSTVAPVQQIAPSVLTQNGISVMTESAAEPMSSESQQSAVPATAESDDQKTQSTELADESTADVADSTAEAQQEDTAADVSVDDQRMNLNTADIETLCDLPGIGETLAGRIVDYREQNGPFETVEELMEVSGIGEKKLAAIQELVYVGE